MTWIWLGAGLALLTLGADVLVRGASRLASAVGLSPLVIGLTVVAYGTSAPEMGVSVASALRGQADIALGNVVGSNIFNVLFILGAAAVVAPLAVQARLVRLDVPLMIGLSLVVGLLGWDGRIGRLEGLGMLVAAVAYTGLLVRQSRRESRAPAPAAEPGGGHAATAGIPEGADRRIWLRSLLAVALGLALLVVGARWFVDSATVIARRLGLSELLVGLTVVAAGTSLPELATSVVASLRGERDIAVGNVVGSNIFNILAVLGAAGAVAPQGLAVSAAALRFDIPVMVAVAAACLPIFFTGHVIARWEGALFVAYYAAYVTYLALAATGHAARGAFGEALLWFALPLTAVTLAILAGRAWRERRRGEGTRAHGNR